MQSKKQLILLVLNELSINSDKNTPLTQTQIAENLSGKLFTCDRKTVCRNIKFLKDMGYPIIKTNHGFYMDKTFSKEDIAFVKSAILYAEGKSDEEKQKLATSVVTVLTKAL